MEKKIKKRKHFWLHYIIVFVSPLLFLYLSFLIGDIGLFENEPLFFTEIFRHIIFGIFLILLFLPLFWVFYYLKKIQKPKWIILLIAFLFNIFMLWAIFSPCMVFTHKKANVAICKSDMESIARAIDMYENKYKCLPHDKYPASEDGILIKEGFLKREVIDTKSKANFIVIYDHEKDKYLILCPDPTKYFYQPKKHLRDLYYDSEKGIVTDPPGK